MSKWKTVTVSDIKPGKRRTGPHKMTKRIMHWSYCSQCGLVALKNQASRKALRQPCVWEED